MAVLVQQFTGLEIQPHRSEHGRRVIEPGRPKAVPFTDLADDVLQLNREYGHGIDIRRRLTQIVESHVRAADNNQ